MDKHCPSPTANCSTRGALSLLAQFLTRSSLPLMQTPCADQKDQRTEQSSLPCPTPDHGNLPHAQKGLPEPGNLLPPSSVPAQPAWAKAVTSSADYLQILGSPDSEASCPWI